ncbi:MAG: replicative DNA helicase [Anaerolineales bacterium]|nr:replicative DNA helicase [Anaerolineales bacterium]
MADFSPSQTENTIIPQIQPHSKEAEEAVLGSILINPEAYYDVASFLQAGDFYILRHAWIYEAIKKLNEKRDPIDLITVSQELDKNDRLAEVGGPAYLSAIMSNTPTSMHAEAYGRRVEETAIRRRMIQAANKIAKSAYSEELDIETSIDNAEKSVFSVSEHRLSSDLKPINVVLSDFYEQIDKIVKRGGDVGGVPTDLVDLDKILNGFQPSDLLIIAGRPGQGKTSFLMTVASNAALKRNKHIAIFSMEMSNEQVVQRMIAQHSGIDAQKLRSGKLSDHEWSLFHQSMEVLGDTHIHLDDTPALTPTQIRAKCRRLHMEQKLDLIIVDYLQLMSGDRRNDNRVQEVSYISRYLKVLARELDVPVLAAAQLSRAVEQRADKRPVLSDLRESGSLEQDADIVMFIYRPELDNDNPERKNVTELLVAKHRNGPTGSVDLVFLEKLTRFENAVRHSYNIDDFSG